MLRYIYDIAFFVAGFFAMGFAAAAAMYATQDVIDGGGLRLGIAVTLAGSLAASVILVLFNILYAVITPYLFHDR
jgi:hypothetical protein